MTYFGLTTALMVSMTSSSFRVSINSSLPSHNPDQKKLNLFCVNHGLFYVNMDKKPFVHYHYHYGGIGHKMDCRKLIIRGFKGFKCFYGFGVIFAGVFF